MKTSQLSLCSVSAPPPTPPQQHKALAIQGHLLNHLVSPLPPPPHTGAPGLAGGGPASSHQAWSRGPVSRDLERAHRHAQWALGLRSWSPERDSGPDARETSPGFKDELVGEFLPGPVLALLLPVRYPFVRRDGEKPLTELSGHGGPTGSQEREDSQVTARGCPVTTARGSRGSAACPCCAWEKARAVAPAVEMLPARACAGGGHSVGWGGAEVRRPPSLVWHWWASGSLSDRSQRLGRGMAVL